MNKETNTASDEQLALGVQQGRQQDLALLVERYHGRLLGLLYRMVGGDRALAEDLVQEAFLRALQAIAQYQPEFPFKPWLYAIATNLARDYYGRADTRHTLSATPELFHHRPSSQPTPAEAVQAQDDARRRATAVAAALQALPPGQREALILRYYEDLRHKEIAQVLAIPVGTVKSRLSLGLKQLHVLLGDEP